MLNKSRVITAMWCLLGTVLSCSGLRAGEDSYIDKARLARAAKFTTFTFEPGGGESDSRDLDGDGWPDFWQKIVDDTNKSYLASDITIVSDPQRQGLFPGEPGSVLQIPFDGTGVAIRTRVPVEISSQMAYEVSLYARTLRLERSLTQMTLRWINIDAGGAENVLGENTLTVPPGQIDWTEAPLRLRVNNVPSAATHLIIVLSIYRDPEYPSADRSGMAWFDDIVITSRPKIYMAPTFQDYISQHPDDPPPPPIDFEIQYRGLVDNVPETARNAERGSAKSYYRIIEISDIFGNEPQGRDGRPLQLSFERRKGIFPGTIDNFPEKIKVNLEKLGVYYLTVRLYGYKGEPLAERTQVLGLWLPPLRRKMGIDEAAPAGGFGVVIEDVPDAVLRQEGALASIVERTGARYVKSIVWPQHPTSGEANYFLDALAREFSLMRRSGVRITAMLEPPQTMRGSQDLYDMMKTRAQNMEPYTEQVTSKFDTLIENWQWGTERERTFSFGVEPESIQGALRLLAGRTSSPAQSFPVALDAENVELPPVEVAFSGTMFVPSSFSPKRMMDALVSLLPRYFWLFREPDRRLYPPQWLYEMSPLPEIVDETRQPQRRLEEWTTIALRESLPDVHNPQLERQMLDDMTKKLVYARVLNMPRTYVAPLIDPISGLTRIDVDGNPVPMPALLGLRVLDEYLNGATYLGSFLLRNQHGEFPNFVFALPGDRGAVCVVWLESGRLEEAPLDFGGGYRLSIVDLQGNVRLLPADTRFIATRTPQIITGMSVPFARTRMSIQILPDPAIKMQAVSQRQRLIITNFYEQSISGEISLDYAARDDFEYEPNWSVEPQTIRFDIGRPLRGEPRDYVIDFKIRPPDSSPVDIGKEYGQKLVSLRVNLMSDRPQTLRLIRKSDMTGDIRLEIRRLTSVDDLGVDVIQMKLRWIPDPTLPHKNEILLRPFFRRSNEMETLLPSVRVPAYRAGDEETPPVSVEYRIPREPRSPETWIGYRQEDGARFFNYNASQLVGSLIE